MPLDVAGSWAPLCELWQTTLEQEAIFPPPDAAEIQFITAIAGPRLGGWVAVVEGEAVGFVLTQPDWSTALRRAGGGRRLHQRAWLAWRYRRKAAAGRILAGGVKPSWRRRGVGRQLWQRVLLDARLQGWQRLSVGPVADGPAAGFLQTMGAEPRQVYQIYDLTL
jgi:GNAT superfamily N-acetyltransferase